MPDNAEIALYQTAQTLPDARRAEFMMMYQGQRKNPTTAFLLSFFLGHLGVDRFYLGQVGLGFLKLCTLGGCLVWWFVDLFLIMGATKRKNTAAVSQLAAMYGAAK